MPRPPPGTGATLKASWKSYDASDQTATPKYSPGTTRYASKAAMGNLKFTDMNVRLLSEAFATVTGQFHAPKKAEAS